MELELVICEKLWSSPFSTSLTENLEEKTREKRFQLQKEERFHPLHYFHFRLHQCYQQLDLVILA